MKNKNSVRKELISRFALMSACLAAAIILGVYVIREVKGGVVSVPVGGTGAEAPPESVLQTNVIESPPETEPKPPEETEEIITEEETAESSEYSLPSDAGTSETQPGRTVITSRERKEYDENSVYIDMENILQAPELPVGCEITALTILLRHLGFDAEKTDLARNYLPTSWGNVVYKDGEVYKDSFFDYFIGDPFSRGYGCFSNAIEKAALEYIEDNGGGYSVYNISGSEPDILYDYVASGTPVLCWGTDGMIEPEYYESWYDNATGEKLDWHLNEHCFVLAGFDMAAGLVTLNDPNKGIIDYNIDKFETRYAQMYSQAIVIVPEGGQS